MGDLGIVYVQPELQTVFEHALALLPDGFDLCFGAFDNEHEVIGIPALHYNRFPLPVISYCGAYATLDTVTPVTSVFQSYPIQ